MSPSRATSRSNVTRWFRYCLYLGATPALHSPSRAHFRQKLLEHSEDCCSKLRQEAKKRKQELISAVSDTSASGQLELCHNVAVAPANVRGPGLRAESVAAISLEVELTMEVLEGPYAGQSFKVHPIENAVRVRHGCAHRRPVRTVADTLHYPTTPPPRTHRKPRTTF